MKSKSKNIEKVFLKLLNNKISLYLVSLIAILVIINNLMNNNFIAVFIFYIIAGLVFLYTKNMTLIFLVSLIGSCIYSNYKNVIFKEGFKENQDSMEENPDNIEEYDEDLEDSYIDPQKNIYNDDYSSDSNSEDDYDTDNEEDFESLKNEKMYEGYSGRDKQVDKQVDKNMQVILNGVRDEHNGYIDHSPPPGYDEIATSIWTKLKKPLNFAKSNINITPGRVANGDFLSESANIKEITNRLEGFKGFEGFKEGTSRPYLNTINNATIGGISYPGGVGSSPDVNRYKKQMAAIEESKKNYKTVEGFKEGALRTNSVGLKSDKTYLKSEAKRKAMKKAQQMSSGRSIEKLEKDFKKSALTVNKSKSDSVASQARANALKKNIHTGRNIRYGEAKFNRKDAKEEYVNNKPLDYSKIKHKKPINTRPKKTLTKGDEMEAAYDNFEKIMGGSNINSLGDTTTGLISKQKELLNGIKEMTPVINEAMGVLNKFDIGSILGGIKQ